MKEEVTTLEVAVQEIASLLKKDAKFMPSELDSINACAASLRSSVFGGGKGTDQISGLSKNPSSTSSFCLA